MWRFLLPLSFSLAVAAPSSAQPVPCMGTLVLGFTPASPNASQPIAITVGVSGYGLGSPPIQTGAVATLQNNAINVTLTGYPLFFAPPPGLTCTTTSIGPLSPGTYPVNLFVVEAGTPNPPPPRLITTSTITITPDLSAVPAISRATVAALAALLFVAALLALHRRLG
jgi:hypothetical protein